MDTPRMIPFTGERSRRGYRLNKLCVSFTEAANREAFKADPDAYMDRYGLSAEERRMLLARDWTALLEYGASVYALGKASSTLGSNLLEMGAAMRGQTTAQFMAEKKG